MYSCRTDDCDTFSNCRKSSTNRFVGDPDNEIDPRGDESHSARSLRACRKKNGERRDFGGRSELSRSPSIGCGVEMSVVMLLITVARVSALWLSAYESLRRHGLVIQ